jgi:8-oxo-dGTP diphosphatase
MHIVVAGALIEDGHVLLVHRSPTRAAYPDRWDLPGGHVEPGESEPQALARELHEELGVRIVPEACSRVGDLRAGAGDDAVNVGVWLVGAWAGRPANCARDEHDDLAWVAVTDLNSRHLAHRGLADLLCRAVR